MIRAGSLLLLACCALGADTVRAEDPQPAEQTPEAQAQALFERGLALSADERWAEARAAFLESTRLVPRASAFFNLAVSSLELGLARTTLDALERFDALSDPVAHAGYRKRAVELRQQALARVGTLELSLSPYDAQLEIDGNVENGAGASRVVLLDPGSHVVRVSAPGHETRSIELTIAARDAAHQRIELRLIPAPVPVAEARPTAPPAPAAALAPTPKPAPTPAPTAERSLWSRPLTWAVIGAVAIAGVTAGILIANHDDASGPYGGSTHKVF